jgi:hypothetical protein
MDLTIDQVKGLAALERKMSSGEQPYVYYAGHRVAVMPEVMKVACLDVGQQINSTLFEAIMTLSLKQVQAKIQIQNALNGNSDQEHDMES